MKASVKVKFNSNALQKTVSNAIAKSSLNLKCPNCENTFKFSGNKIGGSVICPNCHSQIKLNDNKLKQDISNLRI